MVTKKAAPAKPKAQPTADALLALFNVAKGGGSRAEELDALNVIMRVALAGMAQSKAEAAYQKANRTSDVVGRIALMGDRLDAAQDETDAAGAALVKALRGLK